MKNKIINRFILFAILFLLVPFLNASNNNIALELARAKQMEKTIDNVKNIFNFINLYALENGELLANSTALLIAYPDVSSSSYINGKTFNFSISNNLVKFTNVVKKDDISDTLYSIYKNLVLTKLNGVVNADDSISMNLEYKTIKFLSQIDIIRDVYSSSSTGTLSISKDAPQSASYGDLWYRPDANGGFFIYSYPSSGTWEYISNKINMFIYKSSLTELNKIKAPKGTKAYANNGTSTTEVKEYISDGSSWLSVEY